LFPLPFLDRFIGFNFPEDLTFVRYFDVGVLNSYDLTYICDSATLSPQAPEGFFWPYNLLYALLAVVSWLYFTPSLARTARFEVGWIAEISLRNAALLTLISGGLHLRLYITRGQGTKFKYSNKWLARHDSRFLFGNQVWDNIFWNLTSGCLIWTGYEAVTLWLFANGKIPYVDWRRVSCCTGSFPRIPFTQYSTSCTQG
jgi:sterol desaturase/sphingolipid hydroxylase (fatty acid hydroxylase superfamily)